ncbi:hypothetical protein ACTXMK_04910 [Psychrobacter celer]|uniref:hypothetical protein n=1 Tax=Psychrobacter celer TaxID=306572 RepID=UPI003FD1EF1F
MSYIKSCLLSLAVSFGGCVDVDRPIIDIEQDIVIGDLGGVPVEMPRDSVRLVEYNGDPGWGEVRAGAIPERTYASKISSFGFDVRYTDGALYDGIVGKWSDEYEAQKNLSDSPWVSVGVNSGDRYLDTNGIDRIANGRINAVPDEHPVFTYAKLPESQFGLEVYAPPGVDPKTKTPWRDARSAEDVFIQRDDNGTIITYIKCSNRDVEQPPCTHYFDLEPDMKLDVYVSYSRYVLKDWQRIEQVVREALLGFRK